MKLLKDILAYDPYPQWNIVLDAERDNILHPIKNYSPAVNLNYHTWHTRDVTCPECGAGHGKKCRERPNPKKGFVVVGFHAERKILAMHMAGRGLIKSTTPRKPASILDRECPTCGAGKRKMCKDHRGYRSCCYERWALTYPEKVYKRPEYHGPAEKPSDISHRA